MNYMQERNETEERRRTSIKQPVNPRQLKLEFEINARNEYLRAWSTVQTIDKRI